MVNLSRILKSLAVEHSLAVVGFCIIMLLCMFLPHGCTDEFGSLSNSCIFPILSHFSWPLIFFIEYLHFFLRILCSAANVNCIAFIIIEHFKLSTFLSRYSL